MNPRLPKTHHLAGNPKNGPKYFVNVKNPLNKEYSLAAPKAMRALISLMDMQAVAGGAASHFGGPSALVEILSSVYGIMFDEANQSNVAWHEKFHFVNDAGHCENALYVLKALYGFADLNIDSLKGFRSLKSPLTGHGEAHLFPQGVYISNGPLGSGLPQSQGLALAEGLRKIEDSNFKDSRLTVTLISDGGCMEGEAKESLAAIPGFASKGKLGPYVLIISDNNTKLSGRVDEQSFSMKPSFQSLESLGWKVFSLEEAHDLSACLKTFLEVFEWSRNHPQTPVAVHAHTIKGYGIKKLEESPSGGHGFPLKSPKDLSTFLQEIYGDEEIPTEFLNWMDSLIKDEADKKESVEQKRKSAINTNESEAKGEENPKEKVQLGIAKAMIEMREAGFPVISITSDLPGSTGIESFIKKFPEASLDVGIAEANMISTAIGFSKEGYIPVVDTFSQFGVTKGALPLIMSALSQGPVIAVFSHAGFQDAADGASHQALSYFAMTHSLAYTDTYYLSSSEEAHSLLKQCIQNFSDSKKRGETPRSSIFFLGRENFSRRFLPKSYSYQLGKAQLISHVGSEHSRCVVLAANGALLPEALKAAEILNQKSIGCYVVNPSIINHPDVNFLKDVVEKSGGNLVTVEDHQIQGGMGSVIAHSLLCAGTSFRLKSLGVQDQFGQSAYTAHELYVKHGLDATSIVKVVEAWV